MGLDNTLIVFSADHGMSDMPEYAVEQGKDAGRLYSDDVLAMARNISARKFGSEAIVKDFFRPFLYLDAEVIANRDLSQKETSTAIAKELSKEQGIGGAIASHDALRAQEAGISRAVRNNIHLQRAGDIYIYQQANWFLFDRGAVAAMHGSPHSYDTHVPIIFAGGGIKPMQVSREVHPIDVAPTLSARLGIPAPGAAEGVALPELAPLQ